jgi:hypothetical protein
MRQVRSRDGGRFEQSRRFVNPHKSDHVACVGVDRTRETDAAGMR